MHEFALIQERAGLATGGVPPIYADAWARLQCQRPLSVSEDRWRNAINDASLFLDQWAGLALEFGWTARDLFDVPRGGRSGGLVWFLEGEAVRAVGPEHAVTQTGHVFDRFEDNQEGSDGSLA